MTISLLTRCCIGTFLEYFDFILFALLAPTLTAHVFNDITTSQSQQISAFLVLASYWGRPIFAYFWGVISHIWGISSSMRHNFMIMALANVLLAICPSGQTCPHLAPIWLLIARLLQIFAFSGEFTTSLLALSRKKSQQSALLITTSSLGAASASLVAHLTNHSSLWPIAFLISALVLVISSWSSWQQELEKISEKRTGSSWQFWQVLPFATGVISFQLLPTFYGNNIHLHMMTALLLLAFIYPLVMTLGSEKARTISLAITCLTFITITIMTYHPLALTIAIQIFIGMSFYLLIIPLAKTQPIKHFGLGYQIAFMGCSSLISLLTSGG